MVLDFVFSLMANVKSD